MVSFVAFSVDQHAKPGSAGLKQKALVHRQGRINVGAVVSGAIGPDKNRQFYDIIIDFCRKIYRVPTGY